MAVVTLGSGEAGTGHAAPGASADGPGSGGAPERAVRVGASLVRARNGESAALDEIVRELNPLLWHVARSEGLTAEESADVVQTSWLELVRRLDEIRSPQALMAWLVTATRREAWRLRERSRRHVPDGAAQLESIPDPDPSPDERLLTDERDRILWQHVQRLPERCRALLRIVAHVPRPDYTAVAEALGMPVGSIGPTRGRCLAKLRELLGADPGWSES